MSYAADYQRFRRAADPAYAERCREQSRRAKQRRRGLCEVCGAETKYNGDSVAGASRICASCSHQKQHEERKWTRERIIRAFQRFHAETGRVPRTSDKIGLYESQVARFSGTRIREMETGAGTRPDPAAAPVRQARVRKLGCGTRSRRDAPIARRHPDTQEAVR